MLYCYCVALLLFVLSYVLIVCTVPLPPGVNPIAVDKYINPRFVCNIRCRLASQTQQCILTYISVELHVSAYIEAVIRFNIAN